VDAHASLLLAPMLSAKTLALNLSSCAPASGQVASSSFISFSRSSEPSQMLFSRESVIKAGSLHRLLDENNFARMSFALQWQRSILGPRRHDPLSLLLHPFFAFCLANNRK
jgi:hypothetical protein